MKRILGMPLIAAVLLAVVASTANACYCGAKVLWLRGKLLRRQRVLPAAVLHGHEDLQGSRVRAA